MDEPAPVEAQALAVEAPADEVQVTADPAVLAAALEAQAYAVQAVEADNARVATLRARHSELLAEVADIEAGKAYVVKRRDDARLATARAFGFELALEDNPAGLPDAQLLQLLPDADPSSPEGLARWEAWRRDQPARAFRPRGVVQTLMTEARPIKSGLFNSGAILAALVTGRR